jgi:hypothetical protein
VVIKINPKQPLRPQPTNQKKKEKEPKYLRKEFDTRYGILPSSPFWSFSRTKGRKAKKKNISLPFPYPISSPV